MKADYSSIGKDIHVHFAVSQLSRRDRFDLLWDLMDEAGILKALIDHPEVMTAIEKNLQLWYASQEAK